VFLRKLECKKKMPNSRLAQPEKAEFTLVNEHFSGKHNEAVGVFLLTLVTFLWDVLVHFHTYPWLFEPSGNLP
jgi:hypothetical protein